MFSDESVPAPVAVSSHKLLLWQDASPKRRRNTRHAPSGPTAAIFKLTSGGCRSLLSFSPPSSVLANVMGGSFIVKHGDPSLSHKTGNTTKRRSRRRSYPNGLRTQQATQERGVESHTKECLFLSPYKAGHNTRETGCGRSSQSKPPSTRGVARHQGKPRFKITTFGGKKQLSGGGRGSSASCRFPTKRRQSTPAATSATAKASSCISAGSVFLKHLSFRPIKEGLRVGSAASCGSLDPAVTRSGVNYQGWMKSNVSTVSAHGTCLEGVAALPAKARSDSGHVYSAHSATRVVRGKGALNNGSASGRTRVKGKSAQPPSSAHAQQINCDFFLRNRHHSMEEASQTSDVDLRRSSHSDADNIGDRVFARDQGSNHSWSSDLTVCERNKCSSCLQEGSFGGGSVGSSESSCKAVKNFATNASKRSQSCCGARSANEGKRHRSPLLQHGTRSHARGPIVTAGDAAPADCELQEAVCLPEGPGYLLAAPRAKSNPCTVDTYVTCATPHASNTVNAESPKTCCSNDYHANVKPPNACCDSSTTITGNACQNKLSCMSPSTVSKSSGSSSFSSDNGSTSLGQPLDDISMERLQHEFDLRLGKYMSLLCSEAADSPASRRLQARLLKQRRRVGLPKRRAVPSVTCDLGRDGSHARPQHDVGRCGRHQRHPDVCDTPRGSDGEAGSDDAFWFSTTSRIEHRAGPGVLCCSGRPPMSLRRPHSSPAKGSSLTSCERRAPTPSLRFLLRASTFARQVQGEKPAASRSHTKKEQANEAHLHEKKKKATRIKSSPSPATKLDRSGQTTPSREEPPPLKCKPPLWNAAAQTDTTGCVCTCRYKPRAGVSSTSNGVFLTAPTSPSSLEVASIANEPRVSSIALRTATPGRTSLRTLSLGEDDLSVGVDSLREDCTQPPSPTRAGPVSQDNHHPLPSFVRGEAVRELSSRDETVRECSSPRGSGREQQTPPSESSIGANTENDDVSEEGTPSKVEDDLQKYNAVMSRCRALLAQNDGTHDEEDSGSWTHVSEAVDVLHPTERGADDVTTLDDANFPVESPPDSEEAKSRAANCTGVDQSMGDTKPEIQTLKSDMRLDTQTNKTLETLESTAEATVKPERKSRRRASSVQGRETASRSPSAGAKRSSSNPHYAELVDFGNVEAIKRLVEPEPCLPLKPKVTFDIGSGASCSVEENRGETEKVKDGADQPLNNTHLSSSDTDGIPPPTPKKKTGALKKKRSKGKASNPLPKAKVSLTARERLRVLVNRDSVENCAENISPMTSRRIKASDERRSHDNSVRVKPTTLSKVRSAKGGSRPCSQTSWKTVETDTTAARTPAQAVLHYLNDGAAPEKKKRLKVKAKTKKKRKAKKDSDTTLVGDASASPKAAAVGKKKKKKTPPSKKVLAKEVEFACQVLAEGIECATDAVTNKRGSPDGLQAPEFLQPRASPPNDALAAHGSPGKPVHFAISSGSATGSSTLGKDNSPRQRDVLAGSARKAGSSSSTNTTHSSVSPSRRTLSSAAPKSAGLKSSASGTKGSKQKHAKLKTKATSSSASSVLGDASVRKAARAATAGSGLDLLPVLADHYVKVSAASLEDAAQQHRLESLERCRQEFMAFKSIRRGSESERGAAGVVTDGSVLRKCGPLVVAFLIQFLVQYTYNT